MQMNERFAIGVMAKAPVAGEAKTRLIPLLGAQEAAWLQRELCLRTLETVCAAAPGAVTLFSAGAGTHEFWNQCRTAFGVPVVAQEGADLGRRMLNALARLLHEAHTAVLVGTDCPALSARELAQARAQLESARMVFTPAEDGGYVLVGARELAPAAFSCIAWGEDSVMRETRAALAALGWRVGADWHELPALWDIDRPQDFQRALRAGLLTRRWHRYAAAWA